jgi:hypothetical protein
VDAFIKIRLVCVLMLFDVAEEVTLLSTERFTHAIKLALGDTTVQLVNVHPVKTILQFLILLLEGCHALVMIAFRILMACLEGCDNPDKDLCVNLNGS